MNFGNADADGANVNRWTPDNANDNLGVAFSRSLYLALTGEVFFLSALNPAAEHFADFLQRFFAMYILFLIEGLNVKTEPYHGFNYIDYRYS